MNKITRSKTRKESIVLLLTKRQQKTFQLQETRNQKTQQNTRSKKQNFKTCFQPTLQKKTPELPGNNVFVFSQAGGKITDTTQTKQNQQNKQTTETQMKTKRIKTTTEEPNCQK